MTSNLKNILQLVRNNLKISYNKNTNKLIKGKILIKKKKSKKSYFDQSTKCDNFFSNKVFMLIKKIFFINIFF